MIVSHEHRFVFVKTHKTAGTSIERFLARHLGPDAVVTPVYPEVAGHEPRNFDRPFNPVPEIVRTRRIRPAWRDLRRHRTYFNHMPAARIRDRLGDRRWRTYTKFCFERDPWDKVVSWFYFRRDRVPDLSFAEFVHTQELPTDFDLYAIDGQVAMDFVGRYEHLADDLRTVLDRIGLTVPVELGHEKAGVRPPDARVDALFTPELDDRVAQVFRRELAYFDYPNRARRS